MNIYSVFVFAVLAISSVSGIFNPGSGKKCGGYGGGNGYGSGVIIGSSRNMVYISTNKHKTFEENSSNYQKKFIYSNLAVSKHLGNNIFELASILGISRVLNRAPLIFIYNETYREMINRVNTTIPGLLDQFLILNESIPKQVRSVDFNLKCCIFDDISKLLEVNDVYLHLIGLYYQSFKYFPGMQNQLKSYLKKIPISLPTLPSSNNKNHVTCIQVRRGDFFKVGFHVADASFIKKSIKFIEKREHRPGQKITFVLFGDDLPFLKRLSKDTEQNENKTYFVSDKSATEDLVYSMNHCESVFITAAHSTFGWWMGYFSKGNRVFYSDIRVTNDSVYMTGDLNPDDYYPPHWVPLKLDNTLNIVESF